MAGSRVACMALAAIAFAAVWTSAEDLSALDSAGVVVGRRGGATALISSGSFEQAAGNRAGNSEDDELDDELAEVGGNPAKDSIQTQYAELKSKEHQHKGEAKYHDGASKRLLAQADELLQTRTLSKSDDSDDDEDLLQDQTCSFGLGKTVAEFACGKNKDYYSPTQPDGKRKCCGLTASPINERYLVYWKKGAIVDDLKKRDNQRGPVSVEYSPAADRKYPCQGDKAECQITFKWKHGDKDCEVQKTVKCQIQKDSAKHRGGSRRRTQFDKDSIKERGMHANQCTSTMVALHPESNDSSCREVAQKCRL